MEPKYKTLTFNTILFFVSTFAGKFLVFLLMPLYTGKLTPEQYSDADLIIHTTSLILPFITFGIVNSLLRFGLDNNYNKKEVISSSAFVYTLALILAAGLIPIVSNFIPFFKTYGLLLLLYLFSNCLHTLTQQSVRAKENTILYAIDGLLNTLFTLFFTCLFLLPLGMKTGGYILAIILSDILCSVILLFFSQVAKDISFRYIRKDLLKEMLRYCIPIIPASLCWWIIGAADRYFVIAFTSATIGGIYAASLKIPSILNLFSTVFSEAWTISAIKEGNNGDTGDFYNNVFRTFSSMVFIAGAGLILLCKPLLEFMTAETYHSGWHFIPFLLLGSVFSCFSSFASSIYTVLRNPKVNTFTAAIGAVMNVVLNILLIPQVGAIGASVAIFLSHFTIFSLRAIGVQGQMNVKFAPIKLSISTILMLFMCIFTLKEEWLINIIITAFVVVINLPDLFRALKVQSRAILEKLSKSY